MLANEIEERGEISRKQQWDPTVDRTLARMLLLPRTITPIFPSPEFCLAQNERVRISAQRSLLGAKRASRGFVARSAFDPKRTSGARCRTLILVNSGTSAFVSSEHSRRPLGVAHGQIGARNVHKTTVHPIPSGCWNSLRCRWPSGVGGQSRTGARGDRPVEGAFSSQRAKRRRNIPWICSSRHVPACLSPTREISKSKKGGLLLP